MIDELPGYETGPDATVRAEATAWDRIDGARAVVVVEGVSDQIAVTTAARLLGRDLVAEGVVVMPIGGAHAIGRALRELQDRVGDVTIGGLCDVGEERYFRRAISAAGAGEVRERADLERAGFFVCVDDLEDELIRAAGAELVDAVVAAQGDAASFAAMRAQPAWRDARFAAQARRFIAAGATRKHRYAAGIVEALPPAAVPAPLRGVLVHVAP